MGEGLLAQWPRPLRRGGCGSPLSPSHHVRSLVPHFVAQFCPSFEGSRVEKMPLCAGDLAGFDGGRVQNKGGAQAEDVSQEGVPLQVVAYPRLQHLFEGIIDPPVHPAVDVQGLYSETDLLLREVLSLYVLQDFSEYGPLFPAVVLGPVLIPIRGQALQSITQAIAVLILKVLHITYAHTNHRTSV